VRAIYWSKVIPDHSPIPASKPILVAIYGCIVGMLFLGLYPNPLVKATDNAAATLNPQATRLTTIRSVLVPGHSNNE
jgi:hypothetical protein